MDIKESVKFMLAVAADDSHGYDQLRRWGPDYDCSSLVITALEAGGFPVKSKYHATYTGNMYLALSNAGFTNVTSLVNVKTGAGLQLGDVLLTPFRHTEMIVNVAPLQCCSAHINEMGKTVGGKTGDQTQKEICPVKYYNYPWKYILRPPGAENILDTHTIALQVIDGIWGNGITRMIRLKAAGYNYNEVQSEVNKILKG